jgi:hypothetical protein
VASWYLWRSLSAVPPVANTVPALPVAAMASADPAVVAELVGAAAAQPE